MIQKSCYDKDDIAILKESVDIDYLLDRLGVNVVKSTPKEVRGSCIVHGGDNKTAFRFNRQKRTWVCFTHKCHEEYGNDIIGLIKAVLKVDFKTALTFLKELVGDVSTDDLSLEKIKYRKAKEAFIDNYKETKPPKYVSEKSLTIFKQFRSPFFTLPANGGFKRSTLDHFEIAGGYTDGTGMQRDIIPIRDEEGVLVAYSLRDISGNGLNKDFKYILTKPFDKDKVLYNLNNARLFCPDVPLIVVEGFKSVWRLYELGIYNVVAAMGSCVTAGQAKLLKAYAVKGVVLFLDPDEAGRIGTKISIDMLSGVPRVFDVLMPGGPDKDPADLTLETAYDLLGQFVR